MATHMIVEGNGGSDFALIPLFIHPGGAGTTVKVETPSTAVLNVHQNGRHNAATTTVTNGSSTTFTTAPVWIAVPSGVAQLTITGQGYA